MLDELAYEAGSSLGVHDLNGPDAVMGSPDSLRECSYSYEIGAVGVEGAYMEPYEVKLTCFMPDGDFPALRRDADRDVERGVRGRLRVNGVFKQANLTGWERKAAAGSAALFNVTAVLSGGRWLRERRIEFAPASSHGGSALDLPHDLPNDLAAPPARSWVEAPEWCRCMVGFVVYGPCEAPYIVVGGNTYKVSVSVPDGGYLAVDPLDRTVTVTDSQGNVTNALGDASRGSGEGSGEYVFERLPEGASEVSWNNSFSFDMVVYEEEAMPPCAMLR